MKAVIFDMDGLMFDTESICFKSFDYAGEKMGVGKAGFMTLKTLGMNIKKSQELWYKEFGDKYSETKLRFYAKEFLDEFYTTNSVPVKPGLYNLIDYLERNGFIMAVASSSPTEVVHKHLKDTKLFDKFASIVCGDTIKESKPNPEIYLKACKQLNLEPSECYAIEDSKNGILSAKAAGCKTLMVPDLWEPDEETLQILDGKFSDLNDVKEYFSKYP